MCLKRVRSDCLQRIGRDLPPLQADHLQNRRRHFAGQSNDFAHEERPRARVRVKRARRLDLGVSGPRVLMGQALATLCVTLNPDLYPKALVAAMPDRTSKATTGIC
jgi:hypothetical protein